MARVDCGCGDVRGRRSAPPTAAELRAQRLQRRRARERRVEKLFAALLTELLPAVAEYEAPPEVAELRRRRLARWRRASRLGAAKLQVSVVEESEPVANAEESEVTALLRLHQAGRQERARFFGVPAQGAPHRYRARRGENTIDVLADWKRAVGLSSGRLSLNALYTWLPEDGAVRDSDAPDDSGVGLGNVNRYPSANQIWRDVRLLGASVGRYVGRRDLTWAELTGDRAAEVPYTREDISALINSPETVERFVAELEGVLAERRKIRFIFLTYGGGSEPAEDVIDTYTSCVRLYWAREHKTRGHRSTDVVVMEDGSVAASEDSSLFDYLVAVDGLAEAITSFLGSGTWWEAGIDADHDTAWNILDVRLDYDRDYVGIIAEVVAELLLGVLKRLRETRGGSFELSQVIDAIEIFNEVNVRNIVWSEKAAKEDVSARYWAKAYVKAAKGFRAAFKAAGETCPPLWMPSLSSYVRPKYFDRKMAGRWNWTACWRCEKSWFQAFVEEVVKHASEEHPLESLVSGVDYHWYHRAAHSSGVLKDEREEYYDFLHIGHLVDEVAALRIILDDNGLFDAEVSVMETGFGTYDTKRCWGTVDGGVDSIERPHYYAADDITREDSFQAQETVRRLLGALSAGASLVGWHAWLSDSNGDFQSLGLRYDEDGESAPFQAVQRPSWYAYRRIAQIAAQAVSVRMVLPALSGLGTGDLDGWTPSPDEDVLVFELVLRTGEWRDRGEFKQHVYILMMDPWRREIRSACVEYSPTVDDQELLEHSLFPNLASLPDEPDSEEEKKNLPYDTDVSYPIPTITIMYNYVLRELSVAASTVMLSSEYALKDFVVVVCPGVVVGDPDGGIDEDVEVPGIE